MIPKLSKKTSSDSSWRRPTAVSKSRHTKSAKRSSYSISGKYSNKKRNFLRLKKIVGVLIPIFILLALIGGLGLVSMAAWLSRDLPDPKGVINREITVSTKIYDRKGETVLYDVHGDVKRTLINLEELPSHMINATLAAEDRHFYTHRGFSITGIIRSIFVNITTGQRVGGSTLTQQFVKNALLTSEKTYTRKLKELLLSYQMEKRFSKDEILQLYFNEIPFGSVIYGVEAASNSFFGKSARELTIAESAILAAIPKAPTFYSPYGANKDRLIIRQRYIIDSMAEIGYITKEQAQAAKEEKIVFKPLTESIIAPHFVMYVRELLSEKYGENFIAQAGLKVTTSLDLNKQKNAEEAVKRGVEENGNNYQFTNASLTAMDPQTGQILAMVGSVDYFNDDIDGQVNVSLRLRQPGSSFKPMVYTASFIKGYTPDTILYDVVTNFENNKNKKYEPKNYDLEEHGPVTIKKALAGSLNIPAVKATYLTGIDNIISFARDLGYTTMEDKSRFGLSIVLGGAEVKLLEHVAAYSVLANEGVRLPISPILKIEDKNGRVLFEYKKKEQKILDPEIVNLTTDILSDDEARSYVFGTGSKLTLPNRPVAAKTGTTNDYRDAWTMGYTPTLAAGVWVGNNNNKEMKRGAAGGVVAAPIWNYFMTEALKDKPVQDFKKPEKIETGKPVLDGKQTSELTLKIDTMSGKLATQYTPEETIEEITVKEAHNILYYVDKDDPQGDQPENPSLDPQFDNWEEAVLRWATEQGYDKNNNQDIPTQYDDVHLPQDQPILNIITPLPNQTIKDEQLKIEIFATANRDIKEVEYLIDGQTILIKKDSQDAIIDLSSFKNGFHTLTIKAKDDLINTAVKNIDINLDLPKIIPVLNWLSNNQKTISDFPATLSASLTDFNYVKKIDFYYKGNLTSVDGYIGYITPANAEISLVWNKKPATDDYKVYGYIFTVDGEKYKTEELQISIE